MAHSFIGKPISLISHSDVRYRGILAGIDPVASTIQLSNVFSMGTESRRPPEHFIPPVQEPYAYIIFRASEVKDLAVDEAPPRRNVHDDPAVLGASAPIAPGGFPPGSYPPGAYQQHPPQQVPTGVPPPQQQQQQQPYPRGQTPGQSPHVTQAAADLTQNDTPAGGAQNKKNPIHSATASMETVERALGDLRVSNGNESSAPAHTGRGGHGGRRGGRHGDAKQGDLRVPTTDFDFQSSNARFDKTAIASHSRHTPRPAEGATITEENGDAEKAEEGEVKGKDKDAGAYNPKRSFFDSLTSGGNAPTNEGGRGRGGRRGGGGRNRREEERERNVATFGEPGGIGLMGPGAYVGGYGGYGRRGGGRGRRGGPPNTR